MCLAHSKPDEMFEPLLNGMKACEFIYSKEYDQGVLFALKLMKQEHVSHMVKQMEKLDLELKQKGGKESSLFMQFQTGMIKTFGRDEHEHDEHYNAIFSCGSLTKGKKLTVHPGVKVWSPTAGYVEASNEAKSENDEAAVESEQARRKYTKRAAGSSTGRGGVRKTMKQSALQGACPKRDPVYPRPGGGRLEASDARHFDSQASSVYPRPSGGRPGASDAQHFDSQASTSAAAQAQASSGGPGDARGAYSYSGIPPLPVPRSRRLS